MVVRLLCCGFALLFALFPYVLCLSVIGALGGGCACGCCGLCFGGCLFCLLLGFWVSASCLCLLFVVAVSL